MNIRRLILFLLFFSFSITAIYPQAQQRFPKPEFESGYEQPDPTTPEPRALSMEYIDLIVLLAVLLIAAYLVLKKRSRKYILWLSVFTLVYFGFYRNGCICAIGAIQNVALNFFDPGYIISFIALGFFVIPLIFALFSGRTFCAGACPLGAIQDVVIMKPISMSKWLRNVLGLLPYIYLGLAVLYAATASDFIICRYDPFIGIFRMGAPFHMILLGISFLLMGLFIARPYCRFLCPYGVLLNWMSTFSKNHLTITPNKCIQCTLCADSCPFDAIEFPTEVQKNEDKRKNIRRFILFTALIPAWIFIGGLSISQMHAFLAKGNQTVYLARLLQENPSVVNNPDNLDVQTFLASGKSKEQLYEEANDKLKDFYIGSWILGGFLGLVIGVKLLNQVVYRQNSDYRPHKGECFSCGRCLKYCPVKEE